MLSRALRLATVTLLIGCLTAVAVHAVENLEAGKSPAQIFAGTCNACHKIPARTVAQRAGLVAAGLPAPALHHLPATWPRCCRPISSQMAQRIPVPSRRTPSRRTARRKAPRKRRALRRIKTPSSSLGRLPRPGETPDQRPDIMRPEPPAAARSTRAKRTRARRAAKSRFAPSPRSSRRRKPPRAMRGQAGPEPTRAQDF